MRILFLQTLITLVLVITAGAQSKRKTIYDSLLVGDRITPAVSSVMMPKTYTEIILSNALLTTNTAYLENGDAFVLSRRSTYVLNTLQVTHGISASGRFNVGLDLSYRTGRTNADPHSSPLKVFGNDSEGLIQYERAFTSIGFRARYVPTRNRNFVIQHTFYIPFSTTSAESLFLGDNRYAFNTQLLYTQLLGRKVFLFGQADIFVRFKQDQNGTDVTKPINVYATYLLSRHVFPFVQLGMVNAWEDVNRQSYSYGAGLQYQFNSMFNINAFYNDVFAGKNGNQWKTFNFGVRVVI